MLIIEINLGNTRGGFQGNIWATLTLNFFWDNRILNHLNEKLGTEREILTAGRDLEVKGMSMGESTWGRCNVI